MNKKKYWKPNKDEKYYFISTLTSNVSLDQCNNDEFDDSRFDLGNCFRTEEEAVHMIKKLKVINELKLYAYKHNDHSIDFCDYKKKYFIFYNAYTNEIFLNSIFSNFCNCFFSSLI